MTEIQILREENKTLHEVLAMIAGNLTNDDGIDPEAWWLELTSEQASLIRAVVEKNKSPAHCVKSNDPWPPIASIAVEYCEHNVPKGYLCRECHALPNKELSNSGAKTVK